MFAKVYCLIINIYIQFGYRFLDLSIQSVLKCIWITLENIFKDLDLTFERVLKIY